MRAILMFHNCEGQSQDSVHKPQHLKRKERRSGFEPRGPSAYQPNALPLGHTGPQKESKAWSVASCSSSWRGPMVPIRRQTNRLKCTQPEQSRGTSAWVESTTRGVCVCGGGGGG